ncbi:histone-like nucleoid-structuring protein Lsr2 [Streptomyces sp. NPDC059271]|uniref:Lsr2 family DNA-binding protein n=1 Tax=Streptomyces sp. NPDC059271 TaxID=3346799 RepID=UPI0036A72294
MFNDWQQALHAEGLPLHPNHVAQETAAARTIARHAGSMEDLLLLLDAIGLPADDATLTTLLPLMNRPEGEPRMPEQNKAPTDAFEAMALSMHHADASTSQIIAATGLSEEEIIALVGADDTTPGSSASADGPTTAPDGATADAIDELLGWAEAHPTATIRNKAARVRGDLAELTDRRSSDDAQRKAEERVARLRAELEQAQEQLRAAKASPRPAAVATPIRSGLGSGRTRQELALVRAWARENGHQVADAGVIRKAVLEAYDAAHQSPARKAG